MISKTITYIDFNGNERTEEFFFNLSFPELVRMESESNSSYSESLLKMIKANDVASLIAAMENIIMQSYGKKSSDGKRFEKSPELAKAFSETNAYEVLYMDLVTDDKACSEFVSGILPAGYEDNIDRLIKAAEEKNEN